MKHSDPAPRRALRRLKLAVILTGGVTVLIVAGCSAHPIASTTAPEARSDPRATLPSTVPVSISGTGPQSISVPVSLPHATYFYSEFSCGGSTGNGTITLVEDTRVFAGENCGLSAIAYEMPIPNVAILHFTIDVPAASTFQLTGTFGTSR